jgi:hypothetical protein
MNQSLVSKRAFCLLSGLSGVAGVILLVASFAVNPWLPAGVSDAAMSSFTQQHYAAELWGAWLQAVGPVFIVLFAFALVQLAGATNRLSGWMTMLGATTLTTVSLIEITFYLSAMFSEPAAMPAISLKLIYAVQHLYFIVAAPSLFFPLGLVLLGSRVLPRIFGYLALLLAVAFAGAGVIFLMKLVLPDLVTACGAVQPLWWLSAAVALIVKSRKIAAGGAERSSPEPCAEKLR